MGGGSRRNPLPLPSLRTAESLRLFRMTLARRLLGVARGMGVEGRLSERQNHNRGGGAATRLPALAALRQLPDPTLRLTATPHHHRRTWVADCLARCTSQRQVGVRVPGKTRRTRRLVLQCDKQGRVSGFLILLLRLVPRHGWAWRAGLAVGWGLINKLIASPRRAARVAASGSPARPGPRPFADRAAALLHSTLLLRDGGLGLAWAGGGSQGPFAFGSPGSVRVEAVEEG